MPTVHSASIDVCIFRREAGRTLYLLLRASKGRPSAGYWQLLAGEAQPGVVAAQAAMQEVEQHTGLRVVNLWALDYVRTAYAPREDCIQLAPVFVAEVGDGKLMLSTAYEDSRWITFDQALALLRLAGHRECLRRTHDDIVTAEDRGAPFHVAPR